MFQETVAVLVSHVWFSLVFFVSLFEKTWVTRTLKFSYLIIGVDVEISNICSLLLCVSGNGRCAGVACLVHFAFFLSFFEKNLTYLHLKVFIPHDRGSCWDFQRLFFVALCSRKRSLRWCHRYKTASYFFALCLPACVPYATSHYICVSFIGLYALWLVFNTVSAFAL